jgi:hypothetical protein
MIETSDFDQLVQMPKARQAQRPSSPRGLAALARYNPKRSARCRLAAGAAGRHLGDNRKSQDSRVLAFPHAGGLGHQPRRSTGT